MPCGQTDKKRTIIVVGRLVAPDFSALFTAKGDDKPFFGIRIGTERTENPTAVCGAVAGIDIKMQGTKAKGTVIARGISKRGNRSAAGGTDKPAVVFAKPFFFHSVSLFSDAEVCKNSRDDFLINGSAVKLSEISEGKFKIRCCAVRGKSRLQRRYRGGEMLCGAERGGVLPAAAKEGLGVNIFLS